MIGTFISYANFMPPFANLKREKRNFELDPERVPFLKRIPEEIGYRLVSLSMQDHYVEVDTARGRELVHIRFADALRELQHYPGSQTHRSHWISKTGVGRLWQEGRATFVETTDGRKLPVSEPHRDGVRELFNKDFELSES